MRRNDSMPSGPKPVLSLEKLADSLERMQAAHIVLEDELATVKKQLHALELSTTQSNTETKTAIAGLGRKYDLIEASLAPGGSLPLILPRSAQRARRSCRR